MATPNGSPDAPTRAQQHLDLARTYLERNEPEGALRECQSAIAAAPRWAQAHHLLGIVQERSGAKMAAISAYCQAVIFDPAFREPREGLFATEAESRKTTAVALGALVDHWKRDGLDARLGDDLAYLGIDDLAVSVEVLRLDSHPDETTQTGIVSSALTVFSLFPARGRDWRVQDVSTGFGPTQEHALVDATQSWLHRVPPPLLSALGHDAFHDEVGVCDEADEYGMPGRLVYAGHYQIRGSPPKEAGDVLVQHPPFLAIRDLLQEHLAPDQIHWVKLFYSTMGDTGQTDCFVDNANWRPGVDALLSWGAIWRSDPFFLWQFLVLVPKAVENRNMPQDYDKLVSDSLYIFQQHPRASDETIVTLLERQGIREPLAERLNVFVPMAFCRAVLADTGVQFAEDYIQRNGDAEVRRALSSEPVFQAAWRVAQGRISEGMPTYNLLLVAIGAAEMGILYRALNERPDLESVEFGAPVVLCPLDQDVPTADADEPKGRPWWKFW